MAKISLFKKVYINRALSKHTLSTTSNRGHFFVLPTLAPWWLKCHKFKLNFIASHDFSFHFRFRLLSLGELRISPLPLFSESSKISSVFLIWAFWRRTNARRRFQENSSFGGPTAISSKLSTPGAVFQPTVDYFKLVLALTLDSSTQCWWWCAHTYGPNWSRLCLYGSSLVFEILIKLTNWERRLEGPAKPCKIVVARVTKIIHLLFYRASFNYFRV